MFRVSQWNAKVPLNEDQPPTHRIGLQIQQIPTNTHISKEQIVKISKIQAPNLNSGSCDEKNIN